MTKAMADDLEAVRAVVAALQGFDSNDQERILRWAREKLGLSTSPSGGVSGPASTGASKEESTTTPRDVGRPQDIKTFIDSKKPQSDIQFAAAVAYYYRFETLESDRKPSINSSDLQEACRQTGRPRLAKPAQTLVNTHHQGYLDKGGERGSYVLNTVGENLVAMALPESPGSQRAVATSRRRSSKRNAAKPRGKARGVARGKKRAR